MAAKKKTGAAGKISKTAFVKNQPADMAVADIIAKAKEAGIEISKNYVYLIRSKAKHAGPKGVRAPRGRAPRSVAAAPRTGGGSLEKDFQNLVAEIGLSRAEELLRAVRAKFVAAGR